MSDDNVITVDAWNWRAAQNQPRGGTSVEDCFNGVAEEIKDMISFTAIGMREDGTFFLASTEEHTADLLLILARIRQRLMNQFGGDELA